MRNVLKKLKQGKELSQEDKLKLVKKLEDPEIRYGLVWEDHPEDVELLRETHSIVTREIEELRIDKVEGQKPNLLLEGDNIHSLELLKDSGVKVEVIYIDPPYNTLNEKGFAYNDKMIDQNDDFRHSKWLSFMSKRLELARDLMTEDGVIFISIDDNEQAQLKLLCDSIFGEKNFITQFAWVASRSEEIEDTKEASTLGANLGMFKSSYEYIISYRKSKEGKYGLIRSDQKYIETRITKNGNNRSVVKLNKGLRCMRENAVYKNSVGGASEEIKILNTEGIIVSNWELQNDVRIEAQFGNPNMVRKYMEGVEVIDNRGQKVIEIYLTNTGIPYMKKEKKGDLVSNVISGYGDTSIWRKKLEDTLGENVFDYPKPYPLIEKLVGLHVNDNATVLDFFAGSGTTGHAVMELNKEDGGNRRFILCTNNEYQESKKIELIHKLTDTVINTKKNGEPSVRGLKELEEFEQTQEYQDLVDKGVFEEIGICRAVTYERNKRVIEGYTTPKGKKVEGIPNNLSYYKVGLEENNYDTDLDQLERQLEIKEGIPKFDDKGEYSVSHFKNKKYIINKDIVVGDEIIKEINKDKYEIEVYVYDELKNDYKLENLGSNVEIKIIKEV